jgi:signal peptidase complex subunit 2
MSIPTSNGPSYLLNLILSTTSNNGKSLLMKSRVSSGRYIGDFVDNDGGVEEGEVTRWLNALLSEAGMVGGEEGGTKEQ